MQLEITETHAAAMPRATFLNVSRAAAQETLRTATLVSLWLTASVALSLIAALGGGATGVRGSRRVLHRRVTHVS